MRERRNFQVPLKNRLVVRWLQTAEAKFFVNRQPPPPNILEGERGSRAVATEEVMMSSLVWLHGGFVALAISGASASPITSALESSVVLSVVSTQQMWLSDVHHIRLSLPSPHLHPLPNDNNGSYHASHNVVNINHRVSVPIGETIYSIRGGSSTIIDDEHEPKRSRLAKSTKHQKSKMMPNKSVEKSDDKSTTIGKSKLRVQSILLPRQTSMLKPIRLASVLLMNVSFNYCMQTAGRPLEDAVRTVLNLEAGDDKVTPLHIYVAKKILSSTSTTSTPSEILPPAHLPSPLPLLGLLSALLILIGGTILVPKWSVGTDVLLNYEQLKTDETTSWSTLQHWFDGQSEDEVDPYYQPKKPLSPAVLIHEGDLLNPKETICQLLLSPEYNGNLGDCQHRRYYFEFNQKRYYYDPSKSPSLISGGPSLHEESPSYLLSNDIIRGLCTNAKLLHAQERFGPYAHITIPVPTLSSAFAQRVSSPLVALQLLGRLLSILEDESIGKSLANLARLGIQHVSDAKRSIESAITLAKEVKDNEDIADTEKKSRIWAVRPKDCNTTTKGHKSKNRSQWVQLSPTDLLPGDVFLIAPLETKKRAKSLIIPVDALLLEGTCVTEEAALTGESVPQAKVPLDLALDESQDEKTLDMNGHHRTSCIFAGTKLLHSANDDVGVSDMSSDSVSILSKLPSLPNELAAMDTTPSLFLSLRTGTYSSRGEIIQALIRNKMNTGTVSNKDDEIVSMRLIGVLATFAVGACAYLFVDNPGDRRKDSVFKRIVQVRRMHLLLLVSRVFVHNLIVVSLIPSAQGSL